MEEDVDESQPQKTTSESVPDVQEEAIVETTATTTATTPEADVESEAEPLSPTTLMVTFVKKLCDNVTDYLKFFRMIRDCSKTTVSLAKNYLEKWNK